MKDSDMWIVRRATKLAEEKNTLLDVLEHTVSAMEKQKENADLELSPSAYKRFFEDQITIIKNSIKGIEHE